MPSPNILLILTDQHRYDIVGANGSTVCQSPALDALAASGTNFHRAYSVCPLCTPARAAIYTGTLPHRNGITRNIMADDPNPGRIPASIPTLAERLREIDYRSYFVGKWHAGARPPTEAGFTGMDLRGYGDVRHSEDYARYLQARGLDQPEITTIGTGWAHQLTLAGTMSGPVEASVPGYLAERALAYLDEASASPEPFFLALNFFGPHAPYLPSEPYASMYDPADIPPWGNFADDFSGKPPVYQRYRDAFIGEGSAPRQWEDCARWAALYFGFASQIDSQIGRVLERLVSLGVADDTAVLFSADHGDLCGAHGGMHDKGAVSSDAIYRVPLMARIPGGAAGASCQLPVSNIDLASTILDLAGCPYGDDIDGHSLMPILRSRDPGARPDYAAAEFFGHHYAYETRLIVHNDHKYVYHPGATDELYDLTADPWELDNLIGDPSQSGVLQACRQRLLDWCKQTDDDLCVPCGLFHERLTGPPAPYTVNAGDILRQSPTRLHRP